MPTTTVIHRIEHAEAAVLAREAYQEFANLLSSLSAEEFARPTPCEGWTVRHVVGHMVGAMRAAASLREQVSQQREIARRMKREGGNVVDTMTQVQIERAHDVDEAAAVAELQRLVEPATQGRRRTPAVLRRLVRIKVDDGSIRETWGLGYLVDVILTRDAWMHRVDVARAVDREIVVSAAHDGRLVEDVVGDWAERHGQPYELELTGPAGGSFRRGTPGDDARFTLDAVDFMVIVSGRAAGDGLLGVRVPF
ncbi:MAG TPA: maleylpyruvate isomerase family mycothiol-dependent enzyme [Nocardioidaceae bacterium]|nr:maleylpyruvate isomerase family mycothiol-dependent enzyme [Nocardioidaceae bacterium]